MASYARFSRIGALFALALFAPGGGLVANDEAGVAVGPVGPRVTYSPKAASGPARPGTRDRAALQNAMEAAPDSGWRPLSAVADSPAPPAAAPSRAPVPPGAPVPLAPPQVLPYTPAPVIAAPTAPPLAAKPAAPETVPTPSELAAAKPAESAAASPAAEEIAADPAPEPAASPSAPKLATPDASPADADIAVPVAPVAPARRRVEGFAEVSRQPTQSAPSGSTAVDADASPHRIAALLDPAATAPDSAPQRFHDACRASRGSLVGRGSFGICVLN